MKWLPRLLVRFLRRRRRAESPARIRALEVGLGLVEPTSTEAYARPELIDWGSGRRARRERHRFERLNGRPPLITVQGETPPPPSICGCRERH